MGSILSKLSLLKVSFAFALMAMFGVMTDLSAVTLPDPGVDVGGHVTAAITALGAVVAVVAGGYFAFLLIRKAFGWGRKAL